MSNKKLSSSNSHNNISMLQSQPGSLAMRTTAANHSPRQNHSLFLKSSPRPDYNSLPRSSLLRSESSAGSSNPRHISVPRQPFFSPPASQRNSSNNNNSSIVQSSPRMEETDLRNVMKRQKDQLEEQRQRKNIIERKIASLRALNDNQTQALLNNSRTKDLKQEHLELIKKVENFRILQEEIYKLKKTHSKLVSELSMAKAQMVSQRAEMAPHIQRLNALLDTLDRLHVCTKQLQEAVPVGAIQSTLQAIVLSYSGDAENDNKVVAFVSQMNKLLQTRQRFEATNQRPNKFVEEKNHSSGAYSGSNMSVDVLPYSPRNLSAALNSANNSGEFSQGKSPIVPNNRHKILLPSPMSDLSGTELLIRPNREENVTNRSAATLAQQRGAASMMGQTTTGAVAVGAGVTLRHPNVRQADNNGLEASQPRMSAERMDQMDNTPMSGGAPVVAPRVMRRASLLRYASNSFIKDTYFRGSKREELAKKYKESANVLFQNRLSQIRLSPATFSKDSSGGSAEPVPGSESGSSDNSRAEMVDPYFTPVAMASGATADNFAYPREDNDRMSAQLLNEIEVKLSARSDSLSPSDESDQMRNDTVPAVVSDNPTAMTASSVGSDITESPDTQQASTGEPPAVKRFLPKRILRYRVENQTLPPSSGRRIRFSPLTLLLDASLVGDLEMVMRVASEMQSVSEPNEDGITALHNSVCAGYDDISRYLVLHCAADVNAQELDGWTPLHCAAACGSVDMCRLLVEHGAALLMPTLEDGETALEKATNLARESGSVGDGHSACEEYLHEQVMLLWRPPQSKSSNSSVLNSANAMLHSIFDYEPQKEDELPLAKNEQILVIQADIPTEPYWFRGRSIANSTDGLIPKCFVSRFPLLQEPSSLPYSNES